jgi:hypothetical protein
VVAVHSGVGPGNFNVGVRVTNTVLEFLYTMQQWEYFYPSYLPIVLGSTSTSYNKNAINPYPSLFENNVESTNQSPYPVLYNK